MLGAIDAPATGKVIERFAVDRSQPPHENSIKMAKNGLVRVRNLTCLKISRPAIIGRFAFRFRFNLKMFRAPVGAEVLGRLCQQSIP